MIARAGELAREALTGRSLSRAELMAVWDRAGLLGVRQRGYHLLWTLSQQGLTVFGPTDGGEQRLVLLEEWVPHPRRLEAEEALGGVGAALLPRPRPGHPQGLPVVDQADGEGDRRRPGPRARPAGEP